MSIIQKAIVSVAIIVTGLQTASHTDVTVSVAEPVSTSISVGNRFQQTNSAIVVKFESEPDAPPFQPQASSDQSAMLCAPEHGCPACLECLCIDGFCVHPATEVKAPPAQPQISPRHAYPSPMACVPEQGCLACPACLCIDGLCVLPAVEAAILSSIASTVASSSVSPIPTQSSREPKVPRSQAQLSRRLASQSAMLCTLEQGCPPPCQDCVCINGFCVLPPTRAAAVRPIASATDSSFEALTAAELDHVPQAPDGRPLPSPWMCEVPEDCAGCARCRCTNGRCRIPGRGGQFPDGCIPGVGCGTNCPNCICDDLGQCVAPAFRAAHRDQNEL